MSINLLGIPRGVAVTRFIVSKGMPEFLKFNAVVSAASDIPAAF